ncbi:hybrid sensor histidine kinase/response regulator [Flexibacterium corallicola]|uniref:hybrid sensor histidine kinase/response regulator n=1 Tax=Flexibacterium corallicola TaxID=3037259 RepID=UPI00286F611E|nr:PAS-domain containing protein [Pseudovibrio sp. M1P-2-3]
MFVLFILLISLAAISALRYADNEAKLRQSVSDNRVWSSAQTEIEFNRFLNALDAYMMQVDNVSRNSVTLRFDVLWSRVNLFKKSHDQSAEQEETGFSGTVDGLSKAIAQAEPLVKQVTPENKKAYKEIRSLFDPFEEKLRSITLASLRQDTESRLRVRDNLESLLNRVFLFGALGMVSLLGLMISLVYSEVRTLRLLRETLDAQKNTDEARQQLVDAVESLNEGFLLCDEEDDIILCNQRFLNDHPVMSQVMAPGSNFISCLRYGLENGEFLLEEDRTESWLTRRLAERKNKSSSYETRLSDGRWIKVSDRRTEDGRTVSIQTDISQLKKREAALQEAQSILEAQAVDLTTLAEQAEKARETLFGAVESLNECFVLFDEEDKLVLCNSRFKGLFQQLRDNISTGISYEQVLRYMYLSGTFNTEGLDEDDFVSSRLVRRKEKENDPSSMVRYEEQTIDGRWLLVSSKSTRNAGTVSILTDISEAKRQALDIQEANSTLEEQALRLRDLAEEAQAASRAKSEFLAVMSHEIRTPMNAIIGFAGLLLGGDLKGENRQFIIGIEEASQRLLSLISDILDFSKLESGKIKLEAKPFNLVRMIDSCVDVVKVIAGSKPLEISVDIFKGTPENIISDSDRIYQILLNLMSNAVKYTSRGSVHLQIEVVGSSEKTVELCFTITDTGQGISLEAQKNIFKPFERKATDNAESASGSGLGLSICKRLVDLMDGDIGFSSVESFGSRFWFRIHAKVYEGRLPSHVSVAGTDLKHDCKTGESKGLDAEVSSRLKVLVAEDTPASQMVIKTALEKRGHSVVSVDDGAQAVDTMLSQDFDLIIMDMQMPNMDGMTATRHIRKMVAPKCDIPVFALSAQAMDSDKQAAFSAGLSGYLTKPIRWSDLDTLLHAISSEKSGQASAENYLNTMASGIVLPDNQSGHEDQGGKTKQPDVFALPTEDENQLISQKNSEFSGDEKDNGSFVSTVGGSIENGRSYLSRETIEEMVEAVGEDVFKSLLSTFFENADELFSQIKENASKRELDELQKTAHRFSGLLSQFGAIDASCLASSLEVETDLDSALKLVDELLEIAELSVQELREKPLGGPPPLTKSASL